MLTKCPECELQVSDKAISCPHCGYPFDKAVSSRPKKSSKKYKLPNGFGRITRIKSKKLRKPYRAMVSTEKTNNGIKAKILGYYETYNDAYCALVEYNKNPFELDTNMTLLDLYEVWSEKYFKKLNSDSSERTITSAWKYLSPLYYMLIRDIKSYHLKSCILEADCSNNTKNRMKSVLNLMFDYALEYELVDKNSARNFSLSENIDIDEKEFPAHVALKDYELEELWKSDDRWAKVALIQCYSGWRPQELGNIMLKDVDIVNWTFKGGMKTKAGKDRIVPIWSGIRDLVLEEYNYSKSKGFDRLFCCDDGISHKDNNILTYDKYRHRFQNIMPNHKAHDGRKTFVTLCKKYKVDEYAIKYMVGHAIRDITEETYTERENSWLANEIEKIK